MSAEQRAAQQEGPMECIGRLTIGEAVKPTEETRALAGVWLAFTPNTTEEAARRRFQTRYGHEPERLLRRLGLLLAGPVTERMSEPLADLAQNE